MTFPDRGTGNGFPPPPRPVPRPGHRASCPDPERHWDATAAAIVAVVAALALAAAYLAHLLRDGGDPVPVARGPVWVIATPVLAGVAALVLPARLHHTPARWIALAGAAGATGAGLLAEFGGYVLLHLFGAAS